MTADELLATLRAGFVGEEITLEQFEQATGAVLRDPAKACDGPPARAITLGDGVTYQPGGFYRRESAPELAARLAL